MKHSMRNWHIWVSLWLGLPLLLVGLTAVFIAHEKELGTKQVLVPLSYEEKERNEIKTLANVNGQQWLATKEGVYQLVEGLAVSLTGAPKDEIRAITAQPDGVYMAGKMGLWRMNGQDSELLYKGDCWGLQSESGRLMSSCKENGLIAQNESGQWQAMPVAFPANDAVVEQGMPLSKVIMDIHTGKLFLGKQMEWLWIDLLGLACVGLGITGFVMWMRGRRQKASLS